MNDLIPIHQITEQILFLRGQRVILDTDLAELYGVSTGALNQAVKRNLSRFPEDFMFQLTPEEKIKVITNCDNLKKLRFFRGLPYAFTEHGAIMAASLLNSQHAVEISIYVVRAFVKMRELISHHKELVEKMTELEKVVSKHDGHIRTLFEAIRELMRPPTKPKRKIGF